MNNLNQTLHNIMKAVRDYPDMNLADCYSDGQLESKEWLMNEWDKLEYGPARYSEMIYIMGGWYGSLGQQFFNKDYEGMIRSFDIDPAVAEIAETMNRSWVMDGWRFKATTKDIFDINLTEHVYTTLRRDGSECVLTESPDFVINTSGEHMDLAKWWEQVPDGMLCAIQSNDYLEGDGHINCVNSVEELMDQVPMDEVIFSGTLPLDKYNRFMVIGIK